MTTRSIIAPNSICLGVINRLHNFAWISCLLTARNSTLSNGFGSSRAGLCLHNRYFGFLEGVIYAVEDQFAKWTKPNHNLAPIMRNYLRRGV